MKHLNAAISREIVANTRGLPLYRGGPGVDYTNAPVAYAVNATILHIPGFDPAQPRRTPVRPDTPALLVQRASGDGIIGSWSGVSGYVDVVIRRTDFDPIAQAVRTELVEECNLQPEVVAALPLYLGHRFSVGRPSGVLHVLPILGVFAGRQLPVIVPNPAELSGYTWAAFGRLPSVPGINPGYRDSTWHRVRQIARRLGS